MNDSKVLRGGEFLVKDVDFQEVFIPEQFDEEQQMIAQTCEDFLEAEVFPILDRIDKQEDGLMRELITKAGEFGLLGISIAEEYEGFGQSFVTSMLASEAMGAGHSFSVAYSAHTGIGSLPLAYYGNEEQKQRYLPKLATGEWAAAYCLTEPNAGSDANSGKSNAILSEDGKHYILNGQKMWITNGGFADLLTVFAKIDNDRVYSAFLVESGWEGVVINPEEKKMGIKGSSTVQLFFNDVKVPVENLLARRGQGFRIALNILHMGRIKLGAAVLGSAKRTITQSVNYANERKQFGIEISNFAAIKYKLAQQAVRTWVTEAAVYRISENIDLVKDELIVDGKTKETAMIDAIAQYAVEDAAMKVFGSETLDFVVDEGVQIFGGMGFSAEMPVDRSYRDSRINRIFEGTNEINRLVAIGELLKRGMKGELDLLTPAKAVAGELMAIPEFGSTTVDYFEEKHKLLVNFKKSILMVAGAALQKFTDIIQNEQEILMNVADMLMYTYAAESTLLRVEKLSKMYDENKLAIYKDILDVYLYDTANRINKIGVDTVNSFAEGDEQTAMLMGMKRFTKAAPVNVVAARRRIADKMIEENKYCF